MKKMIMLGATCAMLAACSGGKTEFAAEPVADPIAWSDEVTTNDNLKGDLYVDVNGYNAAGQLALVEQYNIKDGARTLATTTIYQNGRPAYAKDVEGDKVTGTDVWTYNPEGFITEEVISAYVGEKQKLEPKTKYTYTYDEQGDLTNIIEAEYKNLRYTDVYEWTYSYADGRLDQRKDYTFDGGQKKQSCWYTYKYNAAGQVEQEDYYFYDIKQGKLKHDAKTLYEYNAAGQTVKATVIRHKNNQKRDDINSRLFTYEYNEAGQPTYEGQQKWASAQNQWDVAVRSTQYAYDEAGRLAQKTSMVNTTKGLKITTETVAYGEGSQTPAAAAAPAASTKPVVNLADKHLTSAAEED